MPSLKAIARLIPDDPKFCEACGLRLVRGQAPRYDPRTGEAGKEVKWAACPDLYVRPNGDGAFKVTGGWPRHTLIQHEPRWKR